jgi:acetyl esterase/lipase
MNTVFPIILGVIAGAFALASILVMFPLKRPTTPAWWALKAIPSLFATFIVAASLMIIFFGVTFSSPVILTLGLYDVLFYSVHIYRISQKPNPSTDLAHAFKSLPLQLSDARKRFLLKTRFGFGFPKVPKPMLTKDVPYCTARDTNRALLCDIWEPAENVPRSHLAFIYVHGSAWCVLDKDVGTRTFFRQLAAQGHVIMDIAYRLYPETGMRGMVHDVRHAVAWMKEHSATYDVHPDMIVLGGGSAGAHLSMLTAYTEGKTEFTPVDLLGRDTTVRGVISLYGPTDLEALYYHNGQNITARVPINNDDDKTPAQLPRWVRHLMGKNYKRLGFDKDMSRAQLPFMFGGHPEETPEPYELYSPVTHIHRHCPPTFLIQGTHDIITPVKATRFLYKKLNELGVPVAMHLIPQVDHGFDLFLPSLYPAARNAYFDIERFLEIMSLKGLDRKKSDALNKTAEVTAQDQKIVYG